MEDQKQRAILDVECITCKSFSNVSMVRKNSDSHASALRKGERADGRSQMDKDYHRCLR